MNKKTVLNFNWIKELTNEEYSALVKSESMHLISLIDSLFTEIDNLTKNYIKETKEMKLNTITKRELLDSLSEITYNLNHTNKFATWEDAMVWLEKKYKL